MIDSRTFREKNSREGRQGRQGREKKTKEQQEKRNSKSLMPASRYFFFSSSLFILFFSWRP